MKVIRFRTAAEPRPRIGVIEGESVFEVDGDGVLDVARRHAAGEEVAPTATAMGYAEVEPLTPIPDPTKIICVGLNYVDHASETEMEAPTVPLLFSKYPSALAGTKSVVELSSQTEMLDYEAELGLVIGTRARDVDRANALDVAAGYMNFNDISARDIQMDEGGQWTRGKSLDTFAPTGPYLVTPDELDDPMQLQVNCRVNGKTLQAASTADMIFPIDYLISFISSGVTLEPGDIIATGTPPGVGLGRQPPQYLNEGDTVEVEIEGLGKLENVVRRKSPFAATGRF